MEQISSNFESSSFDSPSVLRTGRADFLPHDENKHLNLARMD